MSGIAVFNKAVSTLQNSQKNLMAISEARKKLEREKERFEFEKKKTNLEMEGLEISNSLKKDQLETRRKLSDLALKQFQGQLDIKETMIDQEEQNQQGIQENAFKTAKIIAKTNPYVLAPYMTEDGGVGVKPMRTESPARTYSEKSISERDVANLAVKLAGDNDPEEYMEKARRMLSGGVKSETKGQSNVQSKFKAGDIREKNGVRYKRNENGQWLPLS